MFENPAIQKYMYLQAMAQNQAANQANPNAPMGNPEFVQQAMHPMPEGGPDTPIQSGSLKGIEAAKRSLEMNSSENRRAFGRALMNFVANKGVPEVGSGFAGALGAINQGFLPALNAYDAERDRIAQENFALMKHQEEVERHRRQEELNQMKFMHDLASQEREYKEMTAYQKAMADAAMGRAENIRRKYNDDEDGIMGEYPKIKTTKERNEYASTLRGSNMALNALTRMKSDFSKLEESTKNNIVAPFGSIIPGANKIKDFGARLGNAISPNSKSVKSLNEEVVLRKRLESEFARLEPVLERGLKGSAAGEQLLKRFHNLGVYMNSGQPVNVVKDRLEELIEEVRETRDLAKLSLKRGEHIDALPKEHHENEDNGSSVSNRIVSMVKQVNPSLSDEAILEAQRRLINEQ